MNYFAHGFRFLHDPYFLAGTAVPDWLCVADRRVRTRPARALELAGDADPRVAAVAQGIVQHHHDDAWFHNTQAFNQLAWQAALLCRDALPADDHFRPSFLGHVLVELLLDAALIANNPAQLDEYYSALHSVDPQIIQHTVNATARHSTQRLAWFIERFCEVRFLYDYADDEKLLFRLNQVMRRVRLTSLPHSFVEVIAVARSQVTAQAHQLLRQSDSDQRLAG